MLQLTNDYIQAVKTIAQRLQNESYCIRGTTSLILQGIDMNTNDIDVLTDSASALNCNELLKEFMIEEVDFKESDQYRSYYGKFKINNVDVEIMGDWQIFNQKAGWSRKYDACEKEKVMVEDTAVFVTPVILELEMFANMGRWTAFQKIKKQLGDSPKADSKQPSLF